MTTELGEQLEGPGDLAEINVDRLPLRSSQIFAVAIDGVDVRIPVHVFVGKQQRPCLGLVAGVHGDEFDGIRALGRVVKSAKSMPLVGSLVVVPIANPFAFSSSQRRTPQDDKDLNRVFPGSKEGTLSERLAERLCYGVLRKVDFVFSLHGSTSKGVLAPWVEFLGGVGPLERETQSAARASGFAQLIELPRLPGVLLTALADLGIPGIEGEIGGRGMTSDVNVALYLDRIISIAEHLGALEPRRAGRGDKKKAPAPDVARLFGINAENFGLFVSSVKLLQSVQPGDVIGRIVDHFDEPLTQIATPISGIVGALREDAGVRPGDRLVTLWAAEGNYHA